MPPHVEKKEKSPRVFKGIRSLRVGKIIKISSIDGTVLVANVIYFKLFSVPLIKPNLFVLFNFISGTLKRS